MKYGDHSIAILYNEGMCIKEETLIMEEIYKEVYFDKYCPTCKYKNLLEDEEPCCDCLDVSVNAYSHKPVKWEEKS